jgi:hydroxymethylpyrimidine/phosphomethylpyrimidine kinase
VRTVLTIAGSDSGGGAGLQADLRTFTAHGVFGTSAVTAITAQNTREVTTVYPLPADLVAAQIDAVVSDLGADAVKIGMLADDAIVRAVAAAIRRHHLERVVVDPVMVSTTGRRLLSDAGIVVLREEVLPLATVVTPNLAEAEVLTGAPVRTLADARQAAAALVALGAGAAIVTGGHLDGPPVDVLFDGQTCTELTGPRVDRPHLHGTGCTFSSAIAASLARGLDLVDAARVAKVFVADAIKRAPRLGRGRGPVAG